MFNVAIADPKGEVLGIVVFTKEAKDLIIPALTRGKRAVITGSFKMEDGEKKFDNLVLFVEP